MNQVNKTLPAPGQITIQSKVSCVDAVAVEKKALDAYPPVDGTGKVDAKTQAADQLVLLDLGNVATAMTPLVVEGICENFQKSDPDFFRFCPGQKSYERLCRSTKGVSGT